MNGINGQDLDRYITGNYGEDQFRRSPRYPKAFGLGQKARAAGKPITACRCRSKQSIQDWKAGWADEDMCQRTENE